MPAQVRDIVVELPCERPGEGPTGAARSVVLRTDILVLRSLPPSATLDLGGPVNGDGAAAALDDLEARLRSGGGAPDELTAAAEEVGCSGAAACQAINPNQNPERMSGDAHPGCGACDCS